MDVEMVRWPSDESRRLHLRESGKPRLLLVDDDAPAPVTPDPLEDWIRLPADDRDVRARLDSLTLRFQRTDSSEGLTLDDDGLLRNGSNWVALPPIEARLIAGLLAKPGAVVSRDTLLRAGWPGEQPNRNVLDVHVLRLRRRIEPLGLQIRTVRSRGYVLEA